MTSSRTAITREAVSNTSPIQYLHQVGLLDLLAEFYGRVLIPPAVARELDRGRAIGVDLPDVRKLPFVAICTPGAMDKVPRAADLDAGEREVLALGLEKPDLVLILDERLARLHAASLKLAFAGTLGVLLRAKAEGLVPRIAPILETHLRFRVSARTRAAALELAGEDAS